MLSASVSTTALVIVGLVMVAVGLCHNLGFVSRWDSRGSAYLHRKLRDLLPLFRSLWIFGKSPTLILLLLLVLLLNRPAAGGAILIYLALAVAERALKLALKRPRPFRQCPGVEMSQPKEPHDPSYPSGDAMRLWYLALILPAAFSLSIMLLVAFLIIAVMASLGRIAFGVHFLLDVVGGAGLGLIGGGLFLSFF